MPNEELKMVRRHIDAAAERIVRQEQIIGRLSSLSADTEVAEQVLANLQDAQTQHVQHLERLQRR